MTVDPDDLLSPEGRGEVAEAAAVHPTGRRAHAVQRVQIGMAGLAAMLLLVGLANIIISNARQNQAQVVPEAAPTVAPQPSAAPVSDPLADVGVLPDLPEVPVLPTGASTATPAIGDAPLPTQP